MGDLNEVSCGEDVAFCRAQLEEPVKGSVCKADGYRGR
jgi:hypothetical protein